MIEVTLHPTPRWRDVVLEQIRAVALSLRPAAMVFAAVLMIGTILIVGDILGGGPGFDSREMIPTAVISFLLPFAVWRGDSPFGSAFLWTLPIERRRLAFARVIAGGVWMMAALAVFDSWILVLALIAGVPPIQMLARVPVTETIATYMLGSALILGLRHPLRWLLGATGLLLLLGVGSDMLVQPDDGEWRYVPGADAFFSASERAFAAWQTLSDPAQWSISTLLWLAVAFAALLAAASRHHERRRS